MNEDDVEKLVDDSEYGSLMMMWENHRDEGGTVSEFVSQLIVYRNAIDKLIGNIKSSNN